MLRNVVGELIWRAKVLVVGNSVKGIWSRIDLRGMNLTNQLDRQPQSTL